MVWQTPKTNWNDKDAVRPSDMNRIEGNILELKKAATIDIADTAGNFAATNVEGALQELAGNIKNGKTNIANAITAMGQSASGGDTFDTLAAKIRDISKDATAGTGDVLSGKTFYQGGAKKTGTMPNRGAVVITPGTSNKAIVAGYHNGQGYVKGDANLKSDNIKAGVSIFGVQGNVAEGRFFQQYLGDIPASGKVVTFPFNPDVVVGAGRVYGFGVQTAMTVDGVTASAGDTENNRLSIVIEWGTNTALIKGRRHFSSDGWLDYEAKNVTIYAYKCK